MTAPRTHWLSLFRLVVLFVLLVCSALYVHYIDPANSELCGAGSGCEAVRRSKQAYFFGSRYLNIPLIGVLCYGSLLALSILWAGQERSRRWLSWAAAVGGITGIVLVLVQAWAIKSYCWLCLLVDGGAVTAALIGLRVAATEQRDLLRTWAWSVLGLLAVGAPLLFTVVRVPPPVPASISAMYEPGKINVVEFLDFECPYCRRLHLTLQSLNREFGEQVHFKRLNMPLLQHDNAQSAAEAQICAAKMGKGEEMADLLIELRLEEEALQNHASALGLNTKAFNQCRQDPQTRKDVEAQAQVLHEAGFKGLPTTFVGDVALYGLQPDTIYREAYERAAAGGGGLELSGWLFTLMSAAAALTVAWTGRSRQQ